MKKRALLPAMAWLLLCAGLACDEDPAGPAAADPPGIVGTVLDADGLPVAGAPVGLIYGVQVDPDGWPPTETAATLPRAAREVVDLRFSLSEASTVRFLVQDFLYRPHRVLIDGVTLPAGEHSIRFDWADETGEPLPNGLYGTRLEITREGFHDAQQQGGLLRNTLSLGFGSEIGALDSTDAEGRFHIPFSELPIGRWCYCWDGQDGICTIPDSLWVQSASGDQAARRLLRIEDFDQDLEVELGMEVLH